ncbi:adenosine kinase [Candidatus Parcubacteria bacterium]|nr:adenosine kinase [Patescibacteria group bacterium]MBU4309278.1 adenosine kinase [Patescibacteria group bacterium]MBU4432556.1 adenosine kinase [Patescibacteria group bacterium]MBU4577639.1 adenosine kinase [Patescibacteria group bacterium]MCG2697325.1 adenosine kinase [Candidatus Parcubacteria bacterium]
MKTENTTVKNKHWDLLGIGSPLLDIVINIEDKVLDDLKIKKGSMNLISEAESKNILNELSHVAHELSPGGSAANTLSGVNLLGNRTSFLGMIGDDSHGRRYSEEIEKEGIVSHLLRHDRDMTGHSIIFITPDGERTMATHLGASANFVKKHVDENVVRHSKILHIEAYQLENPNTYDAVMHAVGIAKEGNVLISLDLSDVHLIQRNKKLFQDVVREHVDIVFANEEEASEFTDKKDSTEALHDIADNCKIAVVKLGAKGSLIKENGKVYNIEPHKVEMVNTNGAGDMYAAGILHGLVNGLNLQEAGEIASHVSALVVASMGARMDKKHHNLISKYKNL